MTPLLGAVALSGGLIATQRSTMRTRFWWLIAVVAVALAVGGTLEGLDVVPNGRFAVFFGLWALIAGIALSATPAPKKTPHA
jgi:hypothetical protein